MTAATWLAEQKKTRNGTKNTLGQKKLHVSRDAIKHGKRGLRATPGFRPACSNLHMGRPHVGGKVSEANHK